MRLNDEVQALLDAQDWLGLAGYYAQAFNVHAMPDVDWWPFLAAVWGLLALLTLRRIARLLDRPKIPWRLGKVTVDLRGGHDTLHAIVAGMSGTGKSTVVLGLLLLKMPALVVAFDNSRPIRMLFEAMGWTIWTPGGSLGWDILVGSPQIVSEALTSGFDKTEGDTGYNSGMASVRLWRTLEATDASGKPREIWSLIAALRTKSDNPDEDRACRTWANRLERMAMSLGPSLGHDLDLSEAMKHGDKILMLPNRFISPAVAPLVGGIALVQARRVAHEVGGFLLIVEEAGQAGRRQAEIVPLSQAARDRGVPVVLLTQNMAKLPEEVINNTSVWVSFAQESKREVAFACERMRDAPDPATDFDRDQLPTGNCWVRAPGVRPQRVRLSLPRYRKLDYEIVEKRSVGTVIEHVEIDTELVDTEVEVEKEPRAEGPPEMPDVYRVDVPENPRRPGANAGQLINIWQRHRFPDGMDGCFESTFHVNGKSGRPQCSFMGSDWTTYVLIRTLEDARCQGLEGDALLGYLSDVQRQTAAGLLTVDHACELERCDRPDHLSWQSRSRNSELYHERRRNTLRLLTSDAEAVGAGRV